MIWSWVEVGLGWFGMSLSLILRENCCECSLLLMFQPTWVEAFVAFTAFVASMAPLVFIDFMTFLTFGAIR
mgnify:CR=1 FL=1